MRFGLKEAPYNHRTVINGHNGLKILMEHAIPENVKEVEMPIYTRSVMEMVEQDHRAFKELA